MKCFDKQLHLDIPSRKPVEDPKTVKPRPGLGFFNGAKETRTPDPLHAMRLS